MYIKIKDNKQKRLGGIEMIKVYQNEHESGYQFKIEGDFTSLAQKALKDIERISNKGWAYGIGDLLEQNSNLEAVPLEDLNDWEKGWEMTEGTLVKLGEIAFLTYKKIKTKLEIANVKDEMLATWRKQHALSSTRVKSRKMAALMWDLTEREIVDNMHNFKLTTTVFGDMYIADESLEAVFGPAKYSMRSEHVRKGL